MKTKLSAILHLGVWSVATLLFLVQLFSGKPAEQITGNLVALLFWMAVYYLFFYSVTPALLLKKKLFLFIGISFLLLLILPFVGYTLLFLSKALFHKSFSDFYQGYGPSMHLSGLKAMLQAALTGSFFRMITEYYKSHTN